MKTKLAVISALMAFTYSFAQQDADMNASMKNYSKMIDSIVVSEKIKMNKELDDVDHDFKQNKITGDEKQKMQADIAAKYEEVINGKIDAHKTEFEEFTRQAVKNAVLKPSDSVHTDKNQLVFGLGGVSIRMNEGKTNPAEYLRTWQYVTALVGTSYTTKDKPFAFLNNNQDFKNTVFNSATYILRYEIQLGSFTSPFFYKLGLGYRWDQSKAKYGKTFTQENLTLDTKEFTKGNLKDTHINNHYLFIPIDFKLVLNPKYIEHNGTKYLNNKVTQLSIVAGVYGGVRVSSTIYDRYSNDYSKRIVERERINHGMNDLIVGGKFGVGYAGFNVYIQKDFTPAFNNNANLKNKYGLQIGIELLNANF